MGKTAASETRKLRNLLLSCYKTWDKFDPKNLASFYSKSPGVVIFNDVEPVKFEGWNPFKKAVAGIVKKVSTWKLTSKVIKVKQWDKVGLTTATSVFSGKFKTGKKFTANMRHTAVWEKKGYRWQIIHEHWSIPWPAP